MSGIRGRKKYATCAKVLVNIMECAVCRHLQSSHTEDGCEVGWMTYALRDIISRIMENGIGVGNYKLKKTRGCGCIGFVEATTAETEPTPA